jgi:hypothetical protein
MSARFLGMEAGVLVPRNPVLVTAPGGYRFGAAFGNPTPPPQYRSMLLLATEGED